MLLEPFKFIAYIYTISYNNEFNSSITKEKVSNNFTIYNNSITIYCYQLIFDIILI